MVKTTNSKSRCFGEEYQQLTQSKTRNHETTSNFKMLPFHDYSTDFNESWTVEKLRSSSFEPASRLSCVNKICIRYFVKRESMLLFENAWLLQFCSRSHERKIERCASALNTAASNTSNPTILKILAS